MKHLLILFSLLITTSIFSQYSKVPDKGIMYDSLRNESYYRDYGYRNMDISGINTPGKEFNIYVKHHYRGVVLSTIGGVVTGIGTLTYVKNYSGDTFTSDIPVIVAGGIVYLIGLIYTIEAPIHIKRASLLMEKNGVGVIINLD